MGRRGATGAGRGSGHADSCASPMARLASADVHPADWNPGTTACVRGARCAAPIPKPATPSALAEARPVAPARVCFSCFGWRLSSGVTVMSSRAPVGCTARPSPSAV